MFRVRLIFIVIFVVGQLSVSNNSKLVNKLKVLKNFFWNSGYQVFLLLVPFITVPYISKVLGPTGVGINAYTNSITQYFILAGTLGINLYGNRQIAYTRDNEHMLSQTFWELVFMKAMLIVVAIFAFALYLSIFAEYQKFFLMQGIALFAVTFDISWFFQGLENFRITVTRNLIVKITSVILIFMFVKRPGDIALYIAILSSSTLLGNLTLWPYMKKYVHKPEWTSLHPFHHLGPMLQLFVPQIASQLYLQLNKTMLGSQIGVRAAGYYDSSDKVVHMVIAAVTAIGTVMLPHVANNFRKGNHDLVRNALSFSFHFTLVMALPCAFGLATIAPQFTPLFFGNKFLPVSNLMIIESLIIIAIGISSVIGYQFLLPTDQIRPYTTSVFFGALINIVLNWPMIHFLGVPGAMISTVLSEAFVAIYQLIYIAKSIRVATLFTEIWKYLLSSIIMSVVIEFYLRSVTLSWLHMIISIGLGVIIYAVSLLLLRPKILLNQFKSLDI